MNEELLIQKVIGLEADMKEVKQTLGEINGKISLFDDLLSGQDKMIQLLTRVDQESVFFNNRIRRLEEDRVQKLETDMKIVKQHLQLV
ncbi:MAG: hypothetical protein US42_C0003G0045 [Candidatus Magasanikbacteria bacterium GW2011_GWC2_37_14]|uniref:Uncharacterized protein n=1 Tax=Candidatus Magasanikbacteria bacterium GW2011_GWC2_37_14 TaxID=1619046 RepID=A0A0G0GA41_9BACT|nr:MAG: hypothetical protein US42_C0003G0045 [Candidatus Magasanikbacteria bacterium GW2011_GWC2_37_14]